MAPFLDEDWDTALHIINTNVTGTLRLIHLVGRRMRERDAGRIMVTGSIAGHIPGSFQLVYMLDDEDQVVTGFMNKVRAVFADILPDETVAAMQRRMAEPLDR